MPESLSKARNAWVCRNARCSARQPVAHQVVGPAIRVVLQDFRRGVLLQDVLVRVDDEATGAARQVTDPFAGPRRDHLHHHADDVARGAELAVAAGDAQAIQQVLVEVALHILVLAGDLQPLDQLARFDQQRGLVDLELGVAHVALEGAALRAQPAEPGKDHISQVGQRLAGFKLRPVAPAHLSRHARRVGFAAASRLALGRVFAVVQPLQEDEIGKLLDGVHRVG